MKNENAYHIGKFNNTTYFDKIDAIRTGNLDALNKILKSEGMSNLDASDFESLCEDYYDYIKRINKVFESDVDATYGIKGKAAAWGELEGGAGQNVTPFNGKTLRELGIII